MIYISQTAAKEIKRLKQSREGLSPELPSGRTAEMPEGDSSIASSAGKPRQQPDNLIRLSVEKGGCSGLLYILELDNPKPHINEGEAEKSQKTPQRQDFIYESEGITVIVDEQTATQVQGLALDFSEDLMGGGFRFKNPNAIATCQCGLSFRTS